MRLRLAATVVVAIGLAAACGGDDDTATSSPAIGDGAGPASSTPEPASHIEAAVEFAASTWDPHLVRNVSADANFLEPVYDTLVSIGEVDGKYALVPELAESWDVTADSTELTFHLRPGATFHDGTPVDAEAVKVTFERAKTLEGSTVAERFAIVDSIDVVDDLSVTMRLSEPSPIYLWTLADVYGMIISPAAFDSDLNVRPVGSGPYKLVSHSGDVVRYEKFDDYWNPDAGFVRTITTTSVVDENARLNGILAGQYNLVTGRLSMLETARREEAQGNLNVFMGPVINPHTIYFNTSRPGLDDPRVRLAMSLALDRDGINETLFDGECPVEPQVLSENILGHIDAETPYDPERARALLEEAGVSDLSFSMLTVAVGDVVPMATVAQANWAAIGIDVEIVEYNAVEARAEYRNGNPSADLFIASIPGGPDPYLILANLLGPDAPGGLSDTLAALQADADALALDDPQRGPAYEEINRILVEQDPLQIGVCRPPRGWIAAPDVTNVSNLDQIYHWARTAKIGAAG